MCIVGNFKQNRKEKTQDKTILFFKKIAQNFLAHDWVLKDCCPNLYEFIVF